MKNKIYLRVKGLITNPDTEWREITGEKMSVFETFLSYNMPLILLSTLAVFIGALLNYNALPAKMAIIHAAYTFTAFLTSLYIAYLFISWLMPFFNIKLNDEQIYNIVALPSLLIYLVHLIVTLFPEVFFLRLLNLYAGYIIWKGYDVLFPGYKQGKVLLALITSTVVLLLPLGVFSLLYKISGF